MVLLWTKLNPLHPRMICAKYCWNWPSGSGEEDFLISSMYFRYFLIIPPWKRAGPFIWTNLNPLNPRMLCAKFGWNWPSGSGEEVKNRKSLQTDGQTDRQTDRRTDRQTTDERRSEKLTWAFSSGELTRFIHALLKIKVVKVKGVGEGGGGVGGEKPSEGLGGERRGASHITCN